jgi:DNA segregation ATPase FtsK/SpoIIIE-like protein
MKQPETPADNDKRQQPLAPATCSAARLCDEDETLIQDCIGIVRAEKNASVALLQRRLRLGYTRAARLMDELERRGVVSAPLDWKSATRTVLPNVEVSHQRGG